MSEKWWGRFSLARASFWIALIGPSVIIGWVYSVAFVAACSIYANAASDFASWRADRNKEIMKRLETIESKIDELLKGDELKN